jgi:hypothetical protein
MLKARVLTKELGLKEIKVPFFITMHALNNKVLEQFL